MNNIFGQSFRLRYTYKTNSIIWALKGIPLVRRLLPSTLYADHDLKIFAYAIAGIMEFISVFLGKLLYLGIVFAVAYGADTAAPDTFAHIVLFTTVIGGFLNTRIFEPTKDKYYAIFLMRMDAKAYTLTDYLYFMLKMLVGTTAFAFLFGLLSGASVLTCIALPVYVICIKLCFTAVNLARDKKREKSFNENRFSPVSTVSMLALLALSAMPFYLGFALPQWALWGLTAAMLIPSVFAARYIVRYPCYRSVYKKLLKPEYIIGPAGKGAAGAAQQLALQKKMTADQIKTSNKSGYKYFNELFMKRHAKLLTRQAKRIAFIAAAVLALCVAALILFPASHEKVNEVLMTYLPYFLFLMYLINRGRVITQAMFMNCDHSMLAYRFYRQPKALLSLFVERLKYVILINLIPAAVIACGLPLLLFLTGGTDNPLNYLVLFVSILAMSVFFSVHSMVLYYLLQPYNVNLESKSAAYGLLNGVTYMVSYLAIQVKLPTLLFGSAISAFCILYACTAFLLTYRLAPKTFKLRT